MRNVRPLGPFTLLSGSYADGGNGTATNDFLVNLSKYNWVGKVTLQWKVTRTAGSSTTDLSLLISLDGGTTYNALVSFTQITGASGSEVKQVDVPGNALVKTDINMGSGTTSTIKVYAAGFVDGGSGK